MITASAPGKVILFGEHAVVYDRPAIAAPVSQVRAWAEIRPIEMNDVLLEAADLGIRRLYSTAASHDPLAAALRQVQAAAGLDSLRGFSLKVTSEIPIAGGLGSGAAISVAVIRAAAAYLGLGERLTVEQASQMAYEVEKLHHGTPSGIDNTVVAYEQPVFFQRQEPENRIEVFRPAQPLYLLVADTGVRSSTRDVVGDVRRQWQASPARFEEIFDACGRIAGQARAAIIAGDRAELGRLMTENHRLLVRMTVSSAELDRLVEAANRAGAFGAKLSGAGRGGNMIALVAEEKEANAREALLVAGAVRVLRSVINHATAQRPGES